jgi:hypothetical protein
MGFDVVLGERVRRFSRGGEKLPDAGEVYRQFSKLSVFPIITTSHCIMRQEISVPDGYKKVTNQILWSISLLRFGAEPLEGNVHGCTGAAEATDGRERPRSWR